MDEAATRNGASVSPWETRPFALHAAIGCGQPKADDGRRHAAFPHAATGSRMGALPDQGRREGTDGLGGEVDSDLPQERGRPATENISPGGDAERVGSR